MHLVGDVVGGKSPPPQPSPEQAPGRGWPVPSAPACGPPVATGGRGFPLSRDDAGREAVMTGVGGVLAGGRVSQGAGIGRDAGQALPGAAGAGRPAGVRWRWVRHSDGHDPAPPPWWPGVHHDPVPSARRHSDSTDPAPRPWWPGVRQHPVPLWRHSDGHAAPRALRRGVAHDPVPSAGWRCHRR